MTEMRNLILAWSSIAIFATLICVLTPLYIRRRHLHPLNRVPLIFPFICIFSKSLWFGLQITLPLMRDQQPCAAYVLLHTVGIQIFCFYTILKSWFLLFQWEIAVNVLQRRLNDKVPLGWFIQHSNLFQARPMIYLSVLVLTPTLAIPIGLIVMDPSIQTHGYCTVDDMDPTGSLIFQVWRALAFVVYVLIGIWIHYRIKRLRQHKSDSLYFSWELRMTIRGGIIAGVPVLLVFPFLESYIPRDIDPGTWIGVCFNIYIIGVHIFMPILRSYQYERKTVDNASKIKTLRDVLNDQMTYAIFLEHCMVELAPENLVFWDTIDEYKSVFTNGLMPGLSDRRRNKSVANPTLQMGMDYLWNQIHKEPSTLALHGSKADEIKEFHAIDIQESNVPSILYKLLDESHMIYNNYICPDAPSQINIPATTYKSVESSLKNTFTKAYLERLYQTDAPQALIQNWVVQLLSVFDLVQQEIYILMNRDTFMRFQSSARFLDLEKEAYRRLHSKPGSSITKAHVGPMSHASIVSRPTQNMMFD